MNIAIFCIFLVLMMIIVPTPVFAHKLIPTDGGNSQIKTALVIPDPIVSWAMYEELNGGVLYYKFDAKKGDRLYTSIVIPKLNELENFTPSLAFIAPSFSVKLLEELQLIDSHQNFPFDIPDGYDAIVFDYDGVLPSSEFYETFGQITYWERQEINLIIPVDSIYYLAVFDSTNQNGKLALAVGYVEDFSAIDFLTVLPTSWVESRFFMEDYITPIIAFVIFTLVVIGVGVLFYKRIRKT